MQARPSDARSSWWWRGTLPVVETNRLSIGLFLQSSSRIRKNRHARHIALENVTSRTFWRTCNRAWITVSKPIARREIEVSHRYVRFRASEQRLRLLETLWLPFSSKYYKLTRETLSLKLQRVTMASKYRVSQFDDLFTNERIEISWEHSLLSINFMVFYGILQKICCYNIINSMCKIFIICN